MAKFKHLSSLERLIIEQGLKDGNSFKALGRELGRDCTTISKEIRSHLIYKKTGGMGKPFNDCANRFSCDHTYLCESVNCRNRRCCFCSQCHLYCPDYSKTVCTKLDKPPYVCNGCKERSKCTLEKRLYSASAAQAEYEEVRTESRSGFCISEAEACRLDDFISPLIRQGQSIHHICVNNTDEIMYSEKCIYNYVDAGIFSARNIDLPRKVRYRSRKSNHDSFKVDKACRVGRDWNDFQAFLTEWPDCPVVEMDSVEGTKGGKVLLTIHFVKSEFMLAFLRDRNTAASVCRIFDHLYDLLGSDTFSKLFPVLLGDNGSEFSDPVSIEMAPDGHMRTRVFYCDPSAPYQKGAAENNHEFIRRIHPKGKSFDHLTQEKIDLMMDHINSYTRANLGDHSPYEMFRIMYGQEILDVLGANLISPNDIILRPELLK